MGWLFHCSPTPFINCRWPFKWPKSRLPFNYKSHLGADNNFDRTYQAKWIPQNIPTLIFSGEYDHITPLKLFSQEKRFQRHNISILEIKNGSHFPWFDNPEQVHQVFLEFSRLFDAK